MEENNNFVLHDVLKPGLFAEIWDHFLAINKYSLIKLQKGKGMWVRWKEVSSGYIFASIPTRSVLIQSAIVKRKK